MPNPVPAPSIKETAFACPHCEAHANQYWLDTYADRRERDSPTPTVWPREQLAQLEKKHERSKPEMQEALRDLVTWGTKLLEGYPFIDRLKPSKSVYLQLHNVFVSECFNCHKLALWVHDRLLFPPTKTGPAPNADLPPDLLLDYEEARTILDLSPRGAAALLRLAIEKLCDHLGAKGNDTNEKIGWLVQQGLEEVVQQALDTVRVIGNEAVHPGQIDLRDNRDTASELFELVNVIADQMITRPRRVKALYDKLPSEKKAAIERRDKNAPGKKA